MGGTRPDDRIGAVERVYRSELTPGSFLRRSAAVFPERVAVVHEGRRATYRELAERVGRLAGALSAAGLESGDRVAVLCPNTPAMLEATFAVPAGGFVLVPINIRLAPGEIQAILDHSGARFAIVDHELARLVESAPELGVVSVEDSGAPDDPYEQFLATGGSADPPPVEDEEGVISINYTSGTTGRPEGRHVHAPRRLPQRARAGRGSRAALRDRLPVDAADVPLQRLVLPLGGDGDRRDPRVPAQGRCRRWSGG